MVWAAFMVATGQPATGTQPDRWKVAAVNKRIHPSWINPFVRCGSIFLSFHCASFDRMKLAVQNPRSIFATRKSLSNIKKRFRVVFSFYPSNRAGALAIDGSCPQNAPFSSIGISREAQKTKGELFHGVHTLLEKAVGVGEGEV